MSIKLRRVSVAALAVAIALTFAAGPGIARAAASAATSARVLTGCPATESAAKRAFDGLKGEVTFEDEYERETRYPAASFIVLGLRPVSATVTDDPGATIFEFGFPTSELERLKQSFATSFANRGVECSERGCVWKREQGGGQGKDSPLKRASLQAPSEDAPTTVVLTCRYTG